MSGNNVIQTNAAYVANWKERNPKLSDLKTDGRYLEYNNERIDISEIYMQDILSNPNLYYSINYINSNDLFNIIKIHVQAMKIKERELERKVRRAKEYGITI
jgi:hypothetical protein